MLKMYWLNSVISEIYPRKCSNRHTCMYPSGQSGHPIVVYESYVHSVT